MADDITSSKFRRFTSSMILEYACRTDMWDLISSLLMQGLQQFDVHPVLLASATLMSIITKNELDRLTDAVTLLEYIHSQLPEVMPRVFSALLVDIKVKTVMVQLLSNPSTHNRQAYNQLVQYMGCKDCEVECATQVDAYHIELHAEARERTWRLISELAGEAGMSRRNHLLRTEFTLDRQQKLTKDLHEYLDAVRSRLPCRLYELAETYVQQDSVPPPPANAAKLRDFSIRVTKCPLDLTNAPQVSLPPTHTLPPPPPPPCVESPQCMDEGYDACESASQPSDMDGEEVEEPRAAVHIPAKKVLSPKRRGLVAKKRTPAGRPGEAPDSDCTSPCNQMVVSCVTFSSPEFPALWRSGNPLGRVAMRRVQSEEESETESPMCVLHVAGSQGSDIDQSEPDIPSTMENIAMEVGQASKESIISDTESGTTSGGGEKKKTCLPNIHRL